MGGGDGWGQGGVVGGKWRQLYLNNNKKKKKGLNVNSILSSFFYSELQKCVSANMYICVYEQMHKTINKQN